MTPTIAPELSHLEHVPISALTPFQGDLKELSVKNYKKLKKQILENGVIVPFYVWENAGILHILDGHQRDRVFTGEKWDIDVPVIRIQANNEQDAKKKLLAISSQYGKVTQEGWDEFTHDLSEGWALENVHFDALPFVFTDLGQEIEEESDGQDAEPQTNRADELQQEWQTATGQLWILPARDGVGEHRLIVGDCTDAGIVERVMGGDIAELVHADPPYGMGKEKDGIANDNLYREKLDAFQMAWWGTCRPFIADNGSAYIWGNAEDLWRWWYCGGLKDSERLTFRNEIVWDKKSGQGMGSEQHRMYPTASERCLFFMLGEQGFNNNADMFWDGWRDILNWLKEQKFIMGWTASNIHNILGVGDKGGGLASHYFGESQWMLPTKEHYNKLKDTANGQAFKREYDDLKREYDDLKREFYATRAYFDNAHENMTDVWDFGGLFGDDRHGHATPKPVPMVERAIKSSCPSGGIVYVPFAGTCPEVIAAENLNRYARCVEISPAYCAVILQRYQDAFGITGHLENAGK